jgi:hypothetical protein
MDVVTVYFCLFELLAFDCNTGILFSRHLQHLTVHPWQEDQMDRAQKPEAHHTLVESDVCDELVAAKTILST